MVGGEQDDSRLALVPVLKPGHMDEVGRRGAASAGRCRCRRAWVGGGCLWQGPRPKSFLHAQGTFGVGHGHDWSALVPLAQDSSITLQARVNCTCMPVLLDRSRSERAERGGYDK